MRLFHTISSIPPTLDRNQFIESRRACIIQKSRPVATPWSFWKEGGWSLGQEEEKKCGRIFFHHFLGNSNTTKVCKETQYLQSNHNLDKIWLTLSQAGKNGSRQTLVFQLAASQVVWFHLWPLDGISKKLDVSCSWDYWLLFKFR
jgi:hypothetical protein